MTNTEIILGLVSIGVFIFNTFVLTDIKKLKTDTEKLKLDSVRHEGHAQEHQAGDCGVCGAYGVGKEPDQSLCGQAPELPGQEGGGLASPHALRRSGKAKSAAVRVPRRSQAS